MSLKTTISRLLGAGGDSPGTLMRATWRGTLLAESDDTVVVEGNHYFPAESLRRDHFRPSDSHTVCPWKGLASYYDVIVGGEVNRDAAWFYPSPSPLAGRVKDRVAFWRGVEVGPATGTGGT
jgi:uncharacterized protein (DUF427 family)